MRNAVAEAAVEIVDATGRLGPADAAWLRARAGEAMAALGACGEVRVRVVDDAEMSAAHERFSGIAGTTDVLTFDLADGEGAESGRLDVDLLVCVDEASRQASARGHEARREVLLYVVHGMLHALGHDDHDEEAAATMHEVEDRVLSSIGVGATFAREVVSGLREGGGVEGGEGERRGAGGAR